MADFRTFKTAQRLPAEPHKPIVDPAGWLPEEMADLSRWTYQLTQSDIDELVDAVTRAKRARLDFAEVTTKTFPLKAFGAVLEDVRRELRDGRGAVRLKGFPIDRFSHEDTVMAYLGMGAHMGSLEPQNKHGHLLAHVKDLRAHRAVDEGRGYNSNAESSFHVDSTDYVGLLCIGEPKSGGNSRIASSVSIYNHILKHRPDLIEPLLLDVYKSRYGEERAGELPYYTCPVFGFVDGYFSSCSFGRGFLSTQGKPGVPDFTEGQKAALPVFIEAAEACSIDMPFQRGDIQFVNNYVIVHSRRGFEDWNDGRHRHLLRLWLNDIKEPRPIPEGRKERRDRGLHLADVKRQVPLDIEAPIPV
jgi:hypothetical protein